MRNQVQANEFSLLEDLISDILLRLPLESLLACKSVSKQWNNLINNPRFVQLYRNNSTFLFLTKGNLYCMFHDNKMKPRCLPIDQLINQDTKYDDNLLLDSSNKRVCVRAANGDFLVFDLLSGKSYKVIPEISSEEEICLYGFCYNQYADDYYIVLFSNGMFSTGIWYVYSFRDGDWESFRDGDWESFEGFHDATCDSDDDDDDDDIFYWGVTHYAGYSLNGNVHWVVVGVDDRQIVGAFDLHRCRTNEMALPGFNAAYNYNVIPTLAELDGHLCCCDYLIHDDSSGVFDVWVMKEYGVEESWTKLLSIDDRKLLIAPMPFDSEFEWMTPPALYSRDEGRKVEICLGHDSTLRVFEYDLCKDEIRVLHSTTWIMDKIVRTFKRKWKVVWIAILVMLILLIGWVSLTLIIAHFKRL